MLLSSAHWEFRDSSFLVNEPGGQILLTNGSSIRATTGVIPRALTAGTNFGLIRKTSNRDASVQMDNASLIEVAEGRLTVSQGRHTGRFDVSAGATVELQGGLLDTSALIEGAGFFAMDGATVRGRIEVPRVVLEGSAISQFEGHVVLPDLEWSLALFATPLRINGTVELAGRFIGTRFYIRGGVFRTRGAQILPSELNLGEGAILENAGQLTFANGSVGMGPDDAYFVNLPGATVTVERGGRISGSFSNAGTFITQGTGTFTAGGTNSGLMILRGGMTVLFPFVQTGELQLQNAFMQVGNFTGGIVSGTGTNASTTRNSATLRPGMPLGVFAVTSGFYEQTSVGVLEIELGGAQPGISYDQLLVSGSARLAGTLRLSLRHGFVPEIGQEFTILTYTLLAAGSPAFETVQGRDIGGGKRLDIFYEPTRVLVRCVAAP